LVCWDQRRRGVTPGPAFVSFTRLSSSGPFAQRGMVTRAWY